MNFLNTKLMAGAVAVAGLAAPAAAVTVDFEDVDTGIYAIGTSFSGILFDQNIQVRTFAAGAGGPGMDGNIARECSSATICGQFTSGGTISGSFDGFTVSSLSLIAGDSGSDLDTLNLSVFDINGAFLAETGAITSISSIPFSVMASGIASFLLEISDPSTRFDGSSSIDNISFEVEELSAVPLPASLPLMAVALGGLGLMRRRKMAA